MTAYSRTFDIGQAGELVDCSVRRIDTQYIDLSSTPDLEFGIAVTRKNDPAPERGLVPWTSSTITSGNTQRIFGITVFDRTKIQGKYVGNIAVNVLTIGRIRVLAQVEVNIGEKAYLEEGTGLFTNLAQNLDEEDNTEIGVWMSDTGTITEPTLATLSINLEAISFNNV